MPTSLKDMVSLRKGPESQLKPSCLVFILTEEPAPKRSPRQPEDRRVPQVAAWAQRL